MRVALIDDHVQLRGILKRGLERVGDIEVVGEADGGVEGLELVSALQPDAVLIDVNLPDIEGAECARNIKARFPGVRVVAWSGETEGSEEMLRAGADAFVLKGETFEQLIQELRTGNGGSREEAT